MDLFMMTITAVDVGRTGTLKITFDAGPRTARSNAPADRIMDHGHVAIAGTSALVCVVGLWRGRWS